MCGKIRIMIVRPLALYVYSSSPKGVCFHLSYRLFHHLSTDIFVCLEMKENRVQSCRYILLFSFIKMLDFFLGLDFSVINVVLGLILPVGDKGSFVKLA